MKKVQKGVWKRGECAFIEAVADETGCRDDTVA